MRRDIQTLACVLSPHVDARELLEFCLALGARFNVDLDAVYQSIRPTSTLGDELASKIDLALDDAREDGESEADSDDDRVEQLASVVDGLRAELAEANTLRAAAEARAETAEEKARASERLIEDYSDLLAMARKLVTNAGHLPVRHVRSAKPRVRSRKNQAT